MVCFLSSDCLLHIMLYGQYFLFVQKGGWLGWLFGLLVLGSVLHSHHRYTSPFSLCLVSLLTLLRRVVYTPQFFFFPTLTMMQNNQYTISRMILHSRSVSTRQNTTILHLPPISSVSATNYNPNLWVLSHDVPIDLSSEYHDPGINLANNEYNQVGGASKAPSTSFSYHLVGCIQPSKAYLDSDATTVLSFCMNEIVFHQDQQG
jgi:hypothetical protein